MASDREFTAKTPLGPDVLFFSRLEGHDEISRCFRFDLTLVSEDMDIKAEDLLGQAVTVTVGSDEKRFIHGIVDEFSMTGFRQDFVEYRAVLRPWLWFLGKTTDNRIFQNMSIIEIVEEVFSAYPEAKFEKRLRETYDPREYCVQYGETDLEFMQRLLEHEGVYYFFEYADGEHTLILADAIDQLAPVSDWEELEFMPNQLVSFQDGDFITDWFRTARAVSGSYTHTDYDFEKPSADLIAKSENTLGHSQDACPRYHYPGTYIDLGRGDTLAAVRIDELQTPAQEVIARSTARGPCSGALVSLTKYPREAENDEYVVLRSDYEFWDDQFRSAQSERPTEGFQVVYRLMPSSKVLRPARTTPCPVMKGPQTAVVVGPSGEEIYTDEYSRVKVQFHWDRLGGSDENSSCFVRVSSTWAGAGWGFIQIPRIGQEVIIDFLEGDPDQPIITGRVYNASQMPPYGLPGSMTQSGWKSNSTPGGGGWNELRFEDKAGSEEVYFQAQKDHTELVKNDENRLVQHDMNERVDNNSTQSIGVDRTEDVGNNKETTVGVNRDVSIGNNDTETVGVNRSLTVGANETISVGANSSETIGANHSQSVAVAQTITVGAARADTVGAAEARTVGAAQVNVIGAERSMNVGSGQTHIIGSDDGWTIGGSQSVSVASDQSLSIGGGQSASVGKDQSVNVSGGRSTSIGKDDALKVTGKMVVDVGKELAIQAADSITLKCGSATLVMKKDGTISIDGKDINLKGSGKINVKASSDITMKGSKIHQN